MPNNQNIQEREHKDEIRGLLKLLSEGFYFRSDAPDVLQRLVDELIALISCDHIFLSLYNTETKLFKPAARHSSFAPRDIPHENKFMWDSYSRNESVIIHDLSIYTHRLTPEVARTTQMLSMAGVPVWRNGALAGVLEVYANKENAFTDIDVNILKIYANRVSALLTEFDREQEIKYLSAEVRLLRLLIDSEKSPVADLLTRVGMLFKETLPIDGIAVLIVDASRHEMNLQEAMNDGFPPSAIAKLKAGLTMDLQQRLANLPDDVLEKRLLSQPASSAAGEAKSAYIVPVILRKQLQGLLVFCGSELEGINQVRLHRFIRQVAEHTGTILERRNSYNRMQRISLTDALTGLFNRRLFDYALGREIKRVRRTGKPFSLLLLDIDYFKNINDTYGHGAGDRTLSEFGALMTDSFRTTDICTRYGGEEFAIILPETDRNEAMLIAERFRARVAEHAFNIKTQPVFITVSIGIATAGPNTAQSVIAGADQALYQAKQLGRNLTIVWPGT